MFSVSARNNFVKIKTQCCIVGGGPAGMVLGYLLARAGVSVTILEKHPDFLRNSVLKLAPFLNESIAALTSWDNVKTLEVRVDRLNKWLNDG